MNVARFEASVGHNDMVGSVSADRRLSSVEKWLDERNLRQSPDESVFGIDLHNGGDYPKEPVDRVTVVFLLITGENIDTLKTKIDGGQVPIQVRRIQIDMELSEFFSLFRSFRITLSSNQNKGTLKPSEFKGILENVEYQYEEF